MMGWETPLMEAHVKLLRAALRSKIEAGEPISVLNIGYGLGIVRPPSISLFPHMVCKSDSKCADTRRCFR